MTIKVYCSLCACSSHNLAPSLLPAAPITSPQCAPCGWGRRCSPAAAWRRPGSRCCRTSGEPSGPAETETETEAETETLLEAEQVAEVSVLLGWSSPPCPGCLDQHCSPWARPCTWCSRRTLHTAGASVPPGPAQWHNSHVLRLGKNPLGRYRMCPKYIYVVNYRVQ